MLDVFYLTYGSDYSEENFNRIKSKVSTYQNLHNVHNIKGIYNAHKACSMISSTDHFYIIDGDAWLVDKFDLSYIPSDTEEVYPGVPQSKCVHVWRALNPIIDIVYGYGGVKLLHKDLFDRQDVDTIVDMSTTIAKSDRPYWAVPYLSCITKFNKTPYHTWRGAFREVAKLVSGEMSHGAEEKLQKWLNPVKHADFSDYAKCGARWGKVYGEQFKDDPTNMAKLNDYDWLLEEYHICTNSGVLD